MSLNSSSNKQTSHKYSPGRSGRFRLTALATAIFFSVSSASAAPGQYAIPQLKNNFGALVQGANVGQPFRNSAGIERLNIDQFDDRAIIHWESFDVGSRSHVRFRQPSESAIALNRVLSNNGKPTEIYGRITANGRIFIIDHNGVVFGEGSVIDTRSLAASSLDIDDDVFMRGFELAIDDDLPAFFKNSDFYRDGSVVGDMGDIVVKDGALIKVTSVNDNGEYKDSDLGRVMLFAPNVTVEQGAGISSEAGQIIIAATQDEVYLARAKDDSGMRGLVVGISTGGNVTNLGELVAEKGNISLLGMAVNQEGMVRATTSTALNGSIVLRAGDFDGNYTDSAFTGGSENGGEIFLRRGGELVLAEGSTTEVIPDNKTDNDGNVITATDALEQDLSQIDIKAKGITFETGSTVTATGGVINIDVVDDELFTTPAGSPAVPGASVTLESGAVIDVSGADAAVVSVARNYVDVEARGNELADAPIQRDGPIRDKTLTVDSRKGTEFLNADGVFTQTQRDVNERLARGGEVNINTSIGSVDIQQGSTIDISGGKVEYTGAFVTPSQLVTADGQVHDISDADPNLVYAGVLDDIVVEHNKWGIDEVFKTGFGYYEEGYLQGFDAGSLSIKAPEINFEGDLVANTTRGRHQRYRPESLPVDGLQFRNYNQVPLGGELAIEHLTRQLQDVIIGEDEQVLTENGHPDADKSPIVLSPELFSENGVSRVDIKTVGRVVINRDLALQPFSEMSLTGTQVLVNADIIAPGSDLEMTATMELGTFNIANQLTQFTNDDVAPSVVMVDGAIDVSGNWVNDSPVNDGAATGHVVLQGGRVTLDSDLDVIVTSESLINVSGGAQLDSASKLVRGAGGSIDLRSAQSDKRDRIGTTVAEMDIQGELRGFGLGEGGSLSLMAESILITDIDDISPAATSADAADYLLKGSETFVQLEDQATGRKIFAIDASVVQKGGFEDFSFEAVGSRDLQYGLVLSENTTLKLESALPVIKPELTQQAAFEPSPNQRLAGGSSSILDLLPSALDTSAFTDIEVIPFYTGRSVNLSMRASDQQNLVLESGSQIQAGIGSEVDLQSDGNIYIDAEISAPAGSITASIAGEGDVQGINSQIYLGNNASLDVQGAVVTDQSADLGFVTGQVFDAGDVSLTADYGSIYAADGASINVDAASAEFSQQVDGIRADYLVAGDAGKVSFTAAESIIYMGELSGQSAGSGKAGELAFTLNPENRKLDFGSPQAVIDNQNFGEFVVVLGDYNDTLPGFDTSLDADLAGKAYVPVEAFTAGGFDTLDVTARASFSSGGTPHTDNSKSIIEFNTDTNLAVSRRITLDATVLRANGDIDVDLAAPYIALGSSSVFKTDGVRYRGRDDGGANYNFVVTDADVVNLAAAGGDASLDVNATNIDLIGELATVGFGDTGSRRFVNGELNHSADISLVAEQDIRLIGTRDSGPAVLVYDGLFNTASDLGLVAERIYPATLTDYVITVDGVNGSVELASVSSGTPEAPLSIAGSLSINAERLEQGANVFAPVGRLEFNAADQLVFGADSLTSSSGFGVEAPFFTTQPGGDLVFVDNRNTGTAQDIVFVESLEPADEFGTDTVQYDRLLPEQYVLLNSDNVDIREGARFDLRGGTDSRASEFVPGPGGSQDILLSSYSDSFAIVPGIDGITPFDPLLTPAAVSENGLTIGDTLVLETDREGLPAGEYTILPARYALYGGYLVTPASGGAELYSGLDVAMADGSRVITGRYGVNGTGIASSTLDTFIVADGDVVRNRAEYLETPLAELYAGNDLRSATDAGTLTIEVRNTLNLAGSVIAQDSNTAGLGTQVNIISDSVSIVNNLSGGVEVTSAQLQGLGADSILIGGDRQLTSDGLLLSAVASNIDVEAGVSLNLPELILLADNINVQSSANRQTSLSSSAPASESEQHLIINADIAEGINGDAAILAVSDRTLRVQRKEATGGNTGLMTVTGNTTLEASGSVVADVAGDNSFDASLDAAGALLSLGASEVSIGETAGASSGLVLSNDALANMEGGRLRLRADNTINVYGELVNGSGNELSFTELDIDAQKLVGVNNAGDAVSLNADAVKLSNTTGMVAADAGLATNGSGLNINAADTLTLGDGTIKINGYEDVSLATSGAVILDGDGELYSESNVNISSPLITAMSGADYTVTAKDSVLDVVSSNAPSTVNFNAGLASRLQLVAAELNVDGRIVLPSGAISLVQTGSSPASADINIGENAVLDVSGVRKQYGARELITKGGVIEMAAASGNLVLSDSSLLDVSAGDDLAEAGTIAFRAEQGTVSLGSGSVLRAGGSGGNFILDANNLDVDAVNTALAYSELGNILGNDFANKRHVRLRNQSIHHADTLAVTAHDVRLLSDNGDVDIDGTINASGQQGSNTRFDGGEVFIAAGDSVNINATAVINARGLDDGGTPATGSRGGKVSFVALDADVDDAGAANDSVNLVAGSQIDVSGGSNPVFTTERVISADRDLGGSVYVHTRVDNPAAGTFVQGDMLSTVTGASVMDIVATRSINDSNITAGDITGYYNDTNTFMTNTVAAVNGFRVTPGLEIWSATDLTLAADWNLFGTVIAGFGGVSVNQSWHFVTDPLTAGTPGTITLRAADDLVINASLSDSFYDITSFFGPGLPDRLSANDDGWSYVLAAGSDLSSADFTAVNQEMGNIELNTDLDIRTGTGDITVVAGNDILYNDDNAAIYSAGRDKGFDYLNTVLPLNEDKIPTLIAFSDLSLMNAWLGEGAIFPVDGGDVSIYAGGDVLSATAPESPAEWMTRIGGEDLTLGDVPSMWGIAFHRFTGGVGAMGGGDLEFEALGDVENVALVVPTTGVPVDGAAYSSNRFQAADVTTEVAGGGLLDVDIAGNASGIQYYIGRGVADIAVTGNTGDNSTGTGVEIYAGFDALVSLVSGGDINLTGIADIGSVEVSASQDVLGGAPSVNNFYTYSENASIDVRSLGGDTYLSAGSDVELTPVFKMASLSNDVIVETDDVFQFPSSIGQLELLAENNIWFVSRPAVPSRLAQLDIPAEELSSIENPVGGTLGVTLPVASPIHADDPERSLIIAKQGSIATTSNNEWNLSIEEALYMEAGVDISNLNVVVQNNSETDITTIIAGRDIVQPTVRSQNGRFDAGATRYLISGPGTAEFIAGRNIDLGTSSGISSDGDKSNRFLADTGADLILMAGIGEGLDVEAFAEAYFTPRTETISLTRIEKVRVDNDNAETFSLDNVFTDGTTHYLEQDSGQYIVIASNDNSVQDGQVLAQLPEGAFPVTELYTDTRSFFTRGADGQVIKMNLAQSDLMAIGLDGIDLANNNISTADGDGSVAEASGTTIDDLVERVDYRQDVANYLRQRNIAIENDDAVATFMALDASEQRPFIARTLYKELDGSGLYAQLSGTDDYSRGFSAINTLFPNSDPDGGINLLLSTINTLDGGEINMLVPGGSINAGTAATDVIAKEAQELGIYSTQESDINIFVNQDLLVNSTRVFALDSNLLVWSSEGDIDAGKGAKTVVSLPSSGWQIDDLGNLELVVDPPVAGSGLQGRSAGLYAPAGVVNAGDAGIAFDSLVIGATQVLGADNIDAGVSIGVPAASGVGSSVSGAGDVTKSATDVAQTVTDFSAEDEGSTTLGILSVNLEGFGGSDPEEN